MPMPAGRNCEYIGRGRNIVNAFVKIDSLCTIRSDEDEDGHE